MKPSIRTAGGDDVSAITANNIAMARETESRELDPPRVRRGVEAVIADPARGFYLLAESQGTIIGQCMVTYEWSDWRNGNFWWIQSVYVLNSARRRGVFSRLYDELLRLARQSQGVVGIRLYVAQENLSAQETYRSRGMEESRYLVFETDFTTDNP